MLMLLYSVVAVVLDLKGYIGGALGRQEAAAEEIAVPPSVPRARLYECSECNTVFIESKRVRCSKCRSGTLTLLE